MGRVHKRIDPLSIRLNFMTELFNTETWFFNKHRMVKRDLSDHVPERLNKEFVSR